MVSNYLIHSRIDLSTAWKRNISSYSTSKSVKNNLGTQKNRWNGFNWFQLVAVYEISDCEFFDQHEAYRITKIENNVIHSTRVHECVSACAWTVRWNGILFGKHTKPKMATNIWRRLESILSSERNKKVTTATPAATEKTLKFEHCIAPLPN